MADGSVVATLVDTDGAGAVDGVEGIGGVACGDEGVDGLGAVQAAVIGRDAGTGGSGAAPSLIHDLLMWAPTLTFSIRSTYRHSVARLEGFLTLDRRARDDARATGRSPASRPAGVAG